jgi:hypothetical protein
VVLRDLLIGGKTHFADFAVDESIATNTLAERLQRLRDAASSLGRETPTMVAGGSTYRAVRRSS